MAELSEQQEQEVGEPIKVHRSRKGFWFGIIILLIIFGVAGAGYYLFMQLRDRQEGLGGEVKGEMSKQMGDYQQQLTAIQNQLAALEANIASKDDHFSKTVADFSQLHNEKLVSTRKELNEAIEHLQRQLGKTRGDWLLADAEYLLSVANERLHLVGDVNTTREALEAADQRLRESGDVGVIKVREQIAKELSVLRNVAIPDIVGIYATLQGLEGMADKLNLFLPYSGKPLATEAPAKPNDLEGSEPSDDLLDSAISQLEGIVTIRHTEQAVKEILSPEQAQFIREQLRVKLEIIKTALVERNETIYMASLNDVKHWIDQHFVKDAESKALLDELDRLSGIKIRSQFPDISQSFKMLRDVGKLRLETDKAMKPENASEAPVIQPVAPPKAELPKPADSPKSAVVPTNPTGTPVEEAQ